jgi:hypothetical protein
LSKRKYGSNKLFLLRPILKRKRRKKKKKKKKLTEEARKPLKAQTKKRQK